MGNTKLITVVVTNVTILSITPYIKVLKNIIEIKYWNIGY